MVIGRILLVVAVIKGYLGKQWMPVEKVGILSASNALSNLAPHSAQKTAFPFTGSPSILRSEDRPI